MIFVDESIQQTLGYICVGFAYCEGSPDELIHRAIADAGFSPGIDEYKSGYRMEGSAPRQALRDSMYRLVLEHCKLGIYVASIAERPRLLTSIADIAGRLVRENTLETPQNVFVDQGIVGEFPPSTSIRLHSGCDSRRVPGIQLADFVAYHCSYLLKCSISGASKKILIAQGEPHPLAGDEVELDWILRTAFRRHFFVEPRNIEDIKGDDWFFKLAGYGAFFSQGLDPHVKAAAEETFDSMYFGCVW